MFTRSPHRRLAPALASLAAVVALSGCGSSNGDATAEATAPAPAASATADSMTSNGDADSTPSAATSSAPGDSAVPAELQFSAPLVGGGELDAATLATGQPVLLWFWAPF